MWNIKNKKTLLLRILLTCILIPLAALASMPSADTALAIEQVSAGDVPVGEELMVALAMEPDPIVVSGGDDNSSNEACSASDSVEENTVSAGDISASTDDVLKESSEESNLSEGSELSEHVDVSTGDSVANANNTDKTGAVKQNVEILKVILPTDFTVLLYKEAEELKFESQDILLINKSDVPVNVNVNAITYEVKGDSTAQTLADSILSVNVKEFQNADYTLSYGPNLFQPFQIGLDKANAETNAERLLADAESWKPIGAVAGPDYCILRVKGTIAEDYLYEEDLKLGIVFEFEKAEN